MKTSFLVAEKRDVHDTEAQGPIFMYPCQYIGLDDPKRQRIRAGDIEIREAAKNEVGTVIDEYKLFQSGKSDRYLSEGGEDGERLDVKYRMFAPNRKVAAWVAAGLQIGALEDFVLPRSYDVTNTIDGDSDEAVRVLVVRYNGSASEAEEVVPSDSSYGKLFPVSAGDIVISNIAASYGSVAVVPPELDGAVVSSEYTVLRAKASFDPNVLHLILRSPEVRSDILLSSSGANRTRTRWNLMKSVQIPYPQGTTLLDIQEQIKQADEKQRAAKLATQEAESLTQTGLNLTSDTSATILAAFRPPK